MTIQPRIVLVAGFLAAFGPVFPAQAGFQWTAPAGGAVMSSAPRAPAAPVPSVAAESLPDTMGDLQTGNAITTTPDGPAAAAPIFGQGMTNDPITWNAPHGSAARKQAPRAPQSVLPVESTSLYPQSGAAPQTPAPVTASAPVQGGYSTYEVADGFGRDLPLVMAIRQIVPTQYGFVFDDGIDLSPRVSWQGGRPWDLVLQDTLAPLGLTPAIRGNVVSITRGGAAPVQQTSAMGGPVVMTDTLQDSSSMTMQATPVSMVSPADNMDGGFTGTPASAPAAGDLMSRSTWTAPRSSTLRNILEGWSERVGVELYWASEYDYPIQSAVNVQGTFEQAVQTLLKGLSESRPRPMGRLHPNLPEGPAVLVIETRQNSM